MDLLCNSTKSLRLVTLMNLLLISLHVLCHRQVGDIDCQKTEVTFWDPFEKEFSTLMNITECDIQCPKGCVCIIGNSTLSSSCVEGNGTVLVSKLLYPHDPNHSEITTLYLANKSLSGIADYAFSVIADGLEILYLNNNTISNMRSGAYVGLAYLKQLYLAHNLLADLPPGIFDGLSALNMLDLQYNLLTRLRSGAFEGVGPVHRLELGYNMIRDIESGAFEGLISLEELDFDNNEVEELHMGMFGGLVSLLSLDMDFNRIQKVPMGVFDGLNNLEELDLDNNLITTLPSEIFRGLSALEELELDNNKLDKVSPDLFKGLANIEQLALSYNLLGDLDQNVFEGLVKIEELHLSHNRFNTIHPNLFRQMVDLEFLFISHNRLKDIHKNLFLNLTELEVLSLSYNLLSTLSPEIFVQMNKLKILNVSGNNFDRLDPQLLTNFDRLTTLELTKNPLRWITSEVFNGLTTKDTSIYVDYYATCCFIENARCTYKKPPSPFLTCKRLLPYEILRVVVWVVGIAAMIGNMSVLYTRCFHRNSRINVQYLLITNLSIADLFMGIYMLILAAGDTYFTDYFPSHSESWRQSVLCKVAGALSLLSSEASVFFITMISIDRFQGVKYPFSDYRLRKTSARIIITLLWVLALALSVASALIPVINPDLYDASEVCVGLPISRIDNYITETRLFNLNTSSFELRLDVGRAVKSVKIDSESTMFFSIAIFVALNLACFLIVAFCYACIFYAARHISSSAGRTLNSQTELRMAAKMAGIIFTDFCCWMIVVILSILVQTGAVEINPIAYAWIATFLIPINSCINPFLYTLSTYISDRLHRGNTENSTTGVSMTTVK